MIISKTINKAWLVIQHLPKFEQELGTFKTRRLARKWVKKNTTKTKRCVSKIKIVKFVAK